MFLNFSKSESAHSSSFLKAQTKLITNWANFKSKQVNCNNVTKENILDKIRNTYE